MESEVRRIINLVGLDYSIGFLHEINQSRTKDLSGILKNFEKESSKFASDDELVKRIVKLCKFKNDSNDKTHSWNHLISNKKELDDKNPQYILDLIEQLSKNVS